MLGFVQFIGVIGIALANDMPFIPYENLLSPDQLSANLDADPDITSKCGGWDQLSREAPTLRQPRVIHVDDDVIDHNHHDADACHQDHDTRVAARADTHDDHSDCNDYHYVHETVREFTQEDAHCNHNDRTDRHRARRAAEHDDSCHNNEHDETDHETHHDEDIVQPCSRPCCPAFRPQPCERPGGNHHECGRPAFRPGGNHHEHGPIPTPYGGGGYNNNVENGAYGASGYNHKPTVYYN